MPTNESKHLMYSDFINKIDEVIYKYLDKTAFYYMKNDGNAEKISYSRAGQFFNDIDGLLKKYNIHKNERIALIMPHSAYAVLTGIALTYAGITIVLIDASLPKEEINRLITFSEVEAVFTVKQIYKDLSNEVIKAIPCFDTGHGLSIMPLNSLEGYNKEKVYGTKTDSDIIAILYSSGTTGEMKGIMITYESVLKAKEVFIKLSGLKYYMSYLLVLPFNHIAGFTGAMTFFLTGCEIGFIEDLNASKLQKGLLEFQPYYFAMVPKVFEVMEQKIRKIIHDKGRMVEIGINVLLNLSAFSRKYIGINIGRKMFKNITKQIFGENIYGVGVGASPCKKETTEFFLNLGLEWSNLYATTETGVPITATGIYDKYPVGTVGNVKRNEGIDIKILNPDSNGIGEIVVKSELMMKGYFKRSDLTKIVFEDDYFKTGDYGYIDKNDYLYITGRIKESIVLQNGKKVSPQDVDDYYYKKVSNYDIASRGIADDKEQYDTIHMFVLNKGYSENVRQEIIDEFKQISKDAPSMYKLSDIHFVDEIPRTSIGKVKRYCLKIENKYSQKQHIESKSANKSIYEEICTMILTYGNIDAGKISENMRIKEDIGIDSLNIFEICVAIDEKYNISLESYLHENMTVGEIVSMIENEKNENYKSEEMTKYPLKRTDKDYKSFDKFMKISNMVYNIEVVGKERLEPDKNYIFCPNHESHFDGMWVVGSLDDNIKHSICSVAVDYLFEKKIYRKGLIRMGGIPVHRSGNTTTAVKRAYECITKEGYSLLIHPEGTRTRNGELGAFKQGAAKLSVDSGVEIVPVCISGAYEIFPPCRKIPRIFDFKHMRKYKLKIQFGHPVNPEDKTSEEITNELRSQIVKMKMDERE